MLWETRAKQQSLDFISSLKQLSFIPIADFLHVIKNFRSRVIFNIIYPLQSLNTQALTRSSLMRDIDTGSGTLTDLSSLGKMQDFYAIDLFSWGSFSQSFSEENWAAIYYMAPFAFMEEAILDPYLFVEDRKCFLEVAFYIPGAENDYMLNTKSDTGIHQTRSKTTIGLTIGTNAAHTRILNSIIALISALERDIENIGMSRLGSHLLENFL